MSELKDPAIKLFGKTITLSNHKAALDRHLHRHEQPSCSTSQDNKNNSGEDIINLSDEESIEPSACETPKTPDADTETLTTKEDQSDDQTNTSNEKALKKPDKIIPCPRCNSMETKFCYYNNYNVNQPRHFCKKCQRYWTAGGTMRNVPVGSGRRKNKNACLLSYRQIMGSDSLQGDVESNETSNGAVKNFQGFPLQIPSYPGGAWPWSAPVTPHPYSPIGFPMGFYPATPYWGCPIQNPWISPPLTPSSPSTQAPPLNSPILGKHYRDGSMLNAFNMRIIESREEKEAEKSTLLAKELRIDDSNEDSINGARVFKTFLPKFDERIQVANTSLVLQANPAAFSRSINFQEST